MEALRIENLSLRFDALEVLRGISLRVAVGERRAILGPNGAGKTTLFNVVSGQLRPSGGRVYLFGADITGLPPEAMPRLGLARTFQRNNLLPGLTVWENVRLAVQRGLGISRHLLAPVERFGTLRDRTHALLEQLDLVAWRDVPVTRLSYGVQRQVEVAMALASNPRVLLLDEPTAGMSPAETAGIVNLIRRLPRDMTVLIIEHDMDVVEAVADTITVLHHGQVLADGPAAAVRSDPRVLDVYLGRVHGDGVAAHA